MGTAPDDPSSPRSETPGDLILQLGPDVLDCVVEQPGNRLLFIAAVFQDKPGDLKEVRDVGSIGALPDLRPVDLQREGRGRRQVAP